MTESEIWLAILWMTVATIVTRCMFFLFADVVKLPPKLQYALRYAPAAALAAIVLPDLLFLPDGTFELGLHNPKLLAGIGALLFFCLTRQMLGTIAVGMALFTALRLLM